MFKLRPYQNEYIKQIIKSYPEKMQPLVHLATGGGKSVIFKELARRALKQDKKVLFLVAGKSILFQAVEKHFLGITTDVSLMQGAKKFRRAKVLCASIDTLSRRTQLHDELINEYDMVIVDEAHHCTANRYIKFLNKIPKNKWVIGFTATPYEINKRAHEYWTHAVKEITVKDLIKEGFLMEPRIFAVPTMSVQGVKKSMGDYNNKQLFNENNKSKVYGDIIKHYKEKACGKKAICFAINVTHSKIICDRFNKAGIAAVHADADTPDEKRAEIIRDFEQGKYQVLCNVNIFSTGTDIPQIECGIMARPTQSLVLWIQQVGRVLRIHPEVKDCIILDHGDNTRRVGHPLEDFQAYLDVNTENEKDKKKEKKETLPFKTCPDCHFILSKAEKKCPECGYDFKPETIVERESDLVEILNGIKVKEDDVYAKWWKRHFKGNKEPSRLYSELLRLWRLSKNKSLKPNFIFYALNDDFSIDEMQDYLAIPFWFKGR